MLETSLRRALEREEFVLHFQPIVDLRSAAGDLDGDAGALAASRARHGVAGQVHPARRGNRPDRSDRPVGAGARLPRGTRAACAAASRELHVAVNLSPRQFRERDLARSVARVLERTGLRAAASRAGGDRGQRHGRIAEAAIRTLHELKAMGIHLSIDDFGTGYSSLVLPQALPDRHAEGRPVLRARHHHATRTMPPSPAPSSPWATACA